MEKSFVLRILTPLFLLSLVLLGVSDTGKQIEAEITISNSTGSPVAVVTAPFPMNTESLIASSIAGTDGMKIDVHDSADDDVPFSPSPTWTAIEACHLYDAGVFSVNETVDCIDAGVVDIGLMPAPGADLEINDDFRFGADFPYRILELTISTAGLYVTDPDMIWEYCTAQSGDCSTWVALTNVTDNTNGFSNIGIKTVTWDLPLDWIEYTISGDTAFFVRARVTTLVTNANYTTRPVGSIARYQMGYGYVWACDTCDPTDSSFSARSLNGGASVQYEMFVGQDTARTSHRYFMNRTTGVGSVAVAAITSNDFSFRLTGSFDPFNTGSIRQIFNPTGSTSIFQWDALNDGEIDFTVQAATTCGLTNVATGINDYGVHTILVEVDHPNQCRMLVDGSEVAIDLTYSGNATDWGTMNAIGGEGSMFWIEEFTFSIGSTDPDTSTDMQLLITDLSTDFTATFIDNKGSVGVDWIPTFPDLVVGLSAATSIFESSTEVLDQTTDPDTPNVVGVLTPIANFSGALQPTVTVPGNEVVVELSAIQSGGKDIIPSYAVWVILGLIATLAMLIVTYRLTNSHILSFSAASLVIVVVYTLVVFPFWMVLVVAVLGAAIIILGKGIIVGA